MVETEDFLKSGSVVLACTPSVSWESKNISLPEVVDKIENGNSLYIGSCAATAESTLQELTDNWKLADIRIIQMLPGGNLPHLSENVDRFRTLSFYSFQRTGYYQQDAGEGLQDYSPVSVVSVPRLLREGELHVDVAIIKVTPPHKNFVSLGMGVELTKDFIRHAKLVIAEVNENMPWTEGHSKIPCSDIDWWVSVNKPLSTTKELWPGFFERPTFAPEVLEKIGENVIKEIPDRATVKFGVSPLCYSIFPFLRQRKDLGLHNDLLTETLFRLHEEGVITNKYKTIDTGRTVVSQAHGSQDLYEFIDRNPILEFKSGSYINDPQVLAKIDNLITVVGSLKVDLTGQVATDSISTKFYGGVWSDIESILGAKLSKGGKPIVIQPSKSLHGRSNIVLALPPGTGVSVTRSDVEYIVTEYGVAYIYGKSIRERCLALIDIAHPDFRDELLEQAKAAGYISQSQPGKFSKNSYPKQFECNHTTKSGKKVLVRPIKPVDEDNLRKFFHNLSDQSIYLRYFRRMKSMPQRILQKTADIDYSRDMAIVVLSPPDAYQHDIVGIAQWISDPRGLHVPEIAFQIRDDWQGEGLGKYLFRKIMAAAKTMGIMKLKADVLATNKAMNVTFEKSGIPIMKSSDFGVITYTFDLEAVDLSTLQDS
ncbi:acetyl-CoA c-acetyltransferase [Nitzschia inconspicua]|uniref:Acetyl-CoA c-acetyltransferase n=1 Tax=Nitzschia inconspicua TaxID=303405 RepID=A0A9K3Q3D9_9STRA|nr:acetyl-CoA c-acetyltransferase [Nitzschia inconspicua]